MPKVKKKDETKATIEISALDVAAYILRICGPITAMKLQKLVYYCQAWSLVWDEKPLFFESIEAWANGPVIRELYDAHRGQFEVSEIPNGNPTKFKKFQIETITAVLDYYKNFTSQKLSDLTHSEDPWKAARYGLPVTARSDAIISHASMMEYYSSL
jgi:uncharacterized phage-associated protein